MAPSSEFDPFDAEARLNHIHETLRQMETEFFTTMPDLLFDVFCVVWDEHPDMLPKFLESIEFLRSIPETEAEAKEVAARVIKA